MPKGYDYNSLVRIGNKFFSANSEGAVTTHSDAEGGGETASDDQIRKGGIENAPVVNTTAKMFLSSLFSGLALLALSWASCSANARNPEGDTRESDGYSTAVIIILIYTLLPAQPFNHFLHLDFHVQQFLRVRFKRQHYIQAGADIAFNWGFMLFFSYLGSKIAAIRYGNKDSEAGFYGLKDDISFNAAIGYAIPGPFLFYVAYNILKSRSNAKYYTFSTDGSKDYPATEAAVAILQLPIVLGIISFIDLIMFGDINGDNIFLVRSLGSAFVRGSYVGILPKFIGSTIGYFAGFLAIAARYKYVTKQVNNDHLTTQTALFSNYNNGQ